MTKRPASAIPTRDRIVRPPEGLTPNQIVAANLHRLRTEHGWSQAELAARFAMRGFPGWTVSRISDAENARADVDRRKPRGGGPRGQRDRQFNVNDLIAIAGAFNVSAIALLVPETGKWVQVGSGVTSRRRYALRALHIDLSDKVDITEFERSLHDRFREITEAELKKATKDSFASVQERIEKWGGAPAKAKLDRIMQEAETPEEGVRRAFDLYLQLSGRRPRKRATK